MKGTAPFTKHLLSFSSILDEIVREYSPSSWVRLGSIFGLRFSVDFSPLFGLRASRETRVSKDFTKVIGGFGPFFRPVFDRTFAHDGVHVLGGNGWPRLHVSCRRVSGMIGVMSGLATLIKS